MPGALTDYSKFTAEQLREKLRDLNKDTTGKKDVLIARLEGKNEFELFTVAELRLKLKRLGKDNTGNKADLIARLNNNTEEGDEVVEKPRKKQKVEPVKQKEEVKDDKDANEENEKEQKKAEKEDEEKEAEMEKEDEEVKQEKSGSGFWSAVTSTCGSIIPAAVSIISKLQTPKKTRPVEPQEEEEEKQESEQKEEQEEDQEVEDKKEEGEKDEEEENIEEVNETLAKIKFVRHHKSVVDMKQIAPFVKVYRNQVKKHLAHVFSSDSIAMFTPRTNQFSFTVLELGGVQFKILLERCHDHPVGAVWTQAKNQGADWFGEISNESGWIGGMEDAKEPENDIIMRAFEKWFDIEENQNKTTFTYKEPKWNPYSHYGRAS